MDKKLEYLKNEYESITASSQLKRRVERSMKKKKRMTVLKYGAAAAAAFLVVSTVSVNTIPNLAYAMSDVPVLKDVVGVLTLGRFEVKNNENDNASYPQLEEFPGELLKTYINQSLAKVTEKYTKNPAYSDVKIDYTVTRNDGKILSVLFTGTAERNDSKKTVSILDSVNIDVAKSTNEITYQNLIRNTPEAHREVDQILNDAAREQGIKTGVQAEGIRIYFKGTDEIVFFYMPPDDSADEFVQITVPESRISQYLNTDFGMRPAS